jgi:hypothetical protein
LEQIPVRVYLDLDPVFVQLWHTTQGIDMRLGGHTHYITIGQNIGQPGCSVPDCGVKWEASFPPVVLEHWPAGSALDRDALTTIANWRGYGSIEYAGAFYGQKAHSTRALITLPQKCREKFVIALSIHPGETADVAALQAHGWSLTDAVEAAGTPDRYQRFIAGSKAEIGIAKSGYVLARSGWFSDRSACYLASGRPVVAQGTGFEDYLPTGEGLFVFNGVDDAAEAIDRMRREYGRHAQRARWIAREYFDSDVVLARLLKIVGAA